MTGIRAVICSDHPTKEQTPFPARGKASTALWGGTGVVLGSAAQAGAVKVSLWVLVLLQQKEFITVRLRAALQKKGVGIRY